MEQNKPWHTLTRDAAFERLDSNLKGLTSEKPQNAWWKRVRMRYRQPNAFLPGIFYWNSSRIFSF